MLGTAGHRVHPSLEETRFQRRQPGEKDLTNDRRNVTLVSWQRGGSD